MIDGMSNFEDNGLLYWEDALYPIPWQQVLDLPFGNILCRAVNEKSRVKIAYLSKDRTITNRVIFPLRVLRTNQTFYVQAYCFLRGAERTFRIDRIIRADIVVGTFNIPVRYLLEKIESPAQPPKIEPRTSSTDSQEKSYTWLFLVIIIVGYLLWRLFTK